MKIRQIKDALGKEIEISYTLLSDGDFACAIKGFQYPFYKTRIGTKLRNDLGFGIAKTKQLAFEIALKEFKTNSLFKERGQKKKKLKTVY